MTEDLLRKVPKKFKIIPQHDALAWYEDDALWDSLDGNLRRVVLRSLCFWDIGFFARNVTTRWTTSKKLNIRYPIPQFHRDLWEIAVQEDDTLVVCPRGFSKTTAVSKIFSLWLLCFELEKSTIVISSKGLGEEIVGDVRRELEENLMILQLFGQLVPIDTSKEAGLDKWRQSHLQLLNGCELKTLTKGQSVRGLRPTRIIIDDPEEEKDVKNPAIAEVFWSWVWTTLHSSLDEGGHMIVLGTIISASCFVQRLKQEADDRGFRLFEYPAILDFDWNVWNITHDFDRAVEKARPLWPDKWSIPKLRKKLEKIKEKPFMQEFMNVPFIINKTPVFTEAVTIIMEPVQVVGNWHWYVEPLETVKKPDGTEEKRKRKVFVGIDLANGAQNGDYSVIMVRDETFKLVAMYRGKIAQDILAKEFDSVTQYFEDMFIVVENNIGLAFINAAKDFTWFEKFYQQESWDNVTNTQTKKVGWNTNVRTKPIAITYYNSLVRAGLEVPKELHEEITYYYYDEKGGMNGVKPHHDDAVIADSLCAQAFKHGFLAPIFFAF